jgi:predicted permease
MRFDPGLVRYNDAQRRQFYEQVAERARDVSGVQSVAMSSAIPMQTDSVDTEPIAPEGFEFPRGKEYATTLASKIDEHYLDTLGIPLVKGRNFTRQDDAGAPRVAIVNEHLAQHYWPNQDAIGKRFRSKDGDDTWIQIVGVAKTGKYLFIAEPPSDFVYLPYRQSKPQEMTLVARSAGDSASLAAPLREVVRRLDVNMPIFNARTMEALYAMRATRIIDVLIETVGGMGIMGLALSIVGLYGLVAYGASRRTREIGIRMAIGATGPTVLRMVLRQGMVLSVVGLGLGIAGSVGAGAALRSAFPTGNDQRDPIALLLVIPIVLAVTMLAAYVPARRAARINPTEALRYE